VTYLSLASCDRAFLRFGQTCPVYVERFAEELPALFGDFPRSPSPRVRRFDHVLSELGGLGRENNRALLNLAASLLEPGEAYVEVGVYKGASLICAMLGNEGSESIGVDNFSMGNGNRAELEANLERFGLAGRATILEGDAFDILSQGRLEGRRVGVYYYDAEHQYESQLQGLRLIEPYLAERALLIIDDTDWHHVAIAIRDYLATQPRARPLLEIGGREHGSPHWWEGVTILSWQT
jgi:predicted O-methyltransferase YrrM